MMIHKSLHPSDDIDRLYVSRKEGGRRLAGNEDRVDSSTGCLKDYIEKKQTTYCSDRKRHRLHKDLFLNDNN